MIEIRTPTVASQVVLNVRQSKWYVSDFFYLKLSRQFHHGCVYTIYNKRQSTHKPQQFIMEIYLHRMQIV